MSEPSLLLVCGVAAAAVFSLLGLLAGLMHLLGRLFPHRQEGGDEFDAALLAAITSAAASAYPGMRVTRVEETT